MPQFKVLQDGELDSSTCNNSMKLQYLSQEKNRIEIQLQELRLNNKILRNINADLTKDKNNLDLTHLILRNQQLQTKLQQFSQERQRVIDEIFILNQIRVENDKQLQQITSNYEQKIIQLRRSIQFKEGVLQKAEAQGLINQDFEEIVLPPYNVSMHFYEEFQQYKNMVKTLKESNIKLKQENEMMKKQNQELKAVSKQLSDLATSRSSFMEYRNLLLHNQHRSLPHRPSKELDKKYLPKSKVEKSTRVEPNEITGNTFSEITNKKNTTLKRIIKKIQIHNAQLKQKIIILTTKNKQLTKAMQTLIQSNKFYQKTRNSQNEKLQGYRIQAQRYKKVLLRRRQYLRCRSVDKNILCELKPLGNQQESKKKQKIKTTINQLRKMGQQLSKAGIPIRKVDCRSHSCVLDYSYELEQQKQDDERNNNESFKRVMADQTLGFDNQFSIIAGGKRVNYAQMKKKKGSNNIGGFLEEIF